MGMDSRYPVEWTRADGTRVAVELLNFPELVAAHQVLESEDMEDPVSMALLDAIECELIRRWTHKTQSPRQREARAAESLDRAA
jgi:hypothetical protein